MEEWIYTGIKYTYKEAELAVARKLFLYMQPSAPKV